jgi:hypothetical protein
VWCVVGVCVRVESVINPSGTPDVYVYVYVYVLYVHVYVYMCQSRVRVKTRACHGVRIREM